MLTRYVAWSGLCSRLDACGEVSGKRIKSFGSQERDKVLIDEQLSQSFPHENKSTTSIFSLPDQKPLAIDILLIGSD